MMKNEKYGEIKLNKWFPLYVHNNNFNNRKNTKVETYEIKFLDDDKGCQISGPASSDLCVNDNGCVSISINSKPIYFLLTHCMLASAFPNAEPYYSVDHINEDHTNNRISNLQWMTREDNSRKGQAATTKKTNESGGRNGRWIRMYRHFKDEDKEDIYIGLFRNVDNAARTILRNWDQFKKKETDKKPELNTVSGKIRDALSKDDKQARYGCRFEDIEFENNEGEEWHTVPHKYYSSQDEEIYEASSRGRFRGPCGLQIPTPIRKKKYKQVCISGKKHLLHRVIYQTFKGDIPKGFDVKHDDTAPLDNEGYYRNWLEDLSIGQRSDNMKEYHANKGTKSKMEKDKELKDTSNDVIDAIIKTLPLRYEPINDDDDYIDKLMKEGLTYLSYYSAKGNRGSKFVINRKITPEGNSDISSSGSTMFSDRKKFEEIFPIYLECLKEEKPDYYNELLIKIYLKYNINIEDIF